MMIQTVLLLSLEVQKNENWTVLKVKDMIQIQTLKQHLRRISDVIKD